MYMSDNSILWPNGIKVDSDGYAVFYQLGTNKVEVPSEDKWPVGVKLKSPFVYDQNGELVGFVDTKAMIVNGPTTITLPYKEIKAKFTSIAEGDLIINAPNATVTEFTWAVASGEGGSGEGGSDNDEVIITFKYKGCKNLNDVIAVDANYKTTDIVDGVWSEGLADLQNPYLNGDSMQSMFYECTALTAFKSDLSSLTEAVDMFYNCTNLTSFEADLSSLTNSERMFESCTALTSFKSDLSSLTEIGYMMFSGANLTTFEADLSNLTKKWDNRYTSDNPFGSTPSLTTFKSNLSSLTDGSYMFEDFSKLTTFDADLSSLTNGQSMFYNCTALSAFTSDLSSLTNGFDMFGKCANLTSFSSDLSSLTMGHQMFSDCQNLESFSSDLSSLTNGFEMFYYCKLDTSSVERIADTIKDVSGLTESGNWPPTVNKTINIGIGNAEPNTKENAAFNRIDAKGWTVYVNGSRYTSTCGASLTTLDENGEETVTPIPFYAKPVACDKEYARYVDAEGNFYNILGAQFIYGDDLSTYGMFINEEDAAANMRLTKIGAKEIETA